MSSCQSSIAPDKPPSCSFEDLENLEEIISESVAPSNFWNATKNCDTTVNSIDDNITIEFCDAIGDLNTRYDIVSVERAPLLIVVPPENDAQCFRINEIVNNFELDHIIAVDNIYTATAHYPSTNDIHFQLQPQPDASTPTSPENTVNVPEPMKTNLEENKDEAQNPTSCKKRQRDPSKWKQNIRKFNRQHGREYENVKGKIVPIKSVKERMCNSNEKCPFKCSVTVSREERESIHTSFWKLSAENKLHFYSKHIKRRTCTRKRTKNERSKKQYSYEYYFIVSGVKVKVCQAFFLNTLNISKQRIYYFFKTSQNVSTDVPRTPNQGKHIKKTFSEEKKN